MPDCWSGDNPQHLYGTATSPEIDPSIPISQLTLRMKLHTMASANWGVALYVGFKDSLGGAFIPYDTLICQSRTFDREFEVSFAQYAGTGRHLCFQVENFQSIFIGDMVLDFTPTCGNPLIVQMDSVSGTWASLSWQPRQGESSWQYAYNYAGDGPVQWVQTSTPHVLLQGLDPVTEYDFFIQAECSPVDAGPMPTFPVRTVSTTCPDALALPFTEDFSNELLEDCWTNMWFNTNETGHINGDYAAMPPVPGSTDVSSLMVTFRYSSVTGGDLIVGVMDDPADTATFVPVATVSPELSNIWYYHEVIFDSYTGNGKYVAFKDGGIYLDDVTLMETPPCVYPFPVTTEHITGTTAGVVFTPRGTESQWEVACGPAGFNPNMGGAHQTVGYSTPTISGLSPLTTYDVYVRSICGGTPGPWSVKHTFTTQCPPIASLPYTENFDTYGVDADTCYPGCWLRYSSWSNLSPHIVGMQAIDASYAFSLPGALELKGSTSSYWYLAVMPELDTDIDLQGLQVSCNLAYDPLFWTNGVLEVGVMDNPYDPSTFTPVQTVNNPHSAVARFFHYTGTGRYIAFRNTGTTDIYIDDVVLDVAPPCGDPVNLTVSDILGTSALVSWDPVEYGTETDYVVSYQAAGYTGWDSLTVTGHQIHIAGLLPETDYEVRVRCNCVEGSGDYAYASFRTRCDNIGSAQIGNGWWEQAQVPITANRTYSQQLFTESELSLAEIPADINAIELQYRINYPNASSDHRRYLELYMGTTQQETFASATSWVPFNTLQPVFADTVQFFPDDSAQWVTIQFSTPFHYGGSGSIVLAVLANAVSDEGVWFLSERTAENRSIYDYRDEYEPPFAPGSDVLQGICDERYRSNIRFVGCDSTASCPTPNLSVSASGSDAYLHIVPGGTESSWEIEYRRQSDNVWTSYGTVSSVTPVVTGLDFSEDYLIRVRAVCSPFGYSAWRTEFFSTECGTIEHLPFTEDFDAYADESAALIPDCWNRITVLTAPFVGTSGRLYLYKGLVALPPLSDTIDASQLMISFKASAGGLLDIGIMEDPYDSTTFVSDTVLFVPGGMREYEIPLSALSGSISTERYIALFNRDQDNSHYCVSIDDLVLDYIPSCWHPKDVTLDTAYGTTAVVSWTERSYASQWDIEYGPHGFTPGTGAGTVVTVYGNPATLTGLPNNSYLDFYVRADCGGGDVSQWSHSCCSCTTMPCDSTDMCAIRIVMMDGFEGWTGYPSVGWADVCLDVYIDGVRQTSVTLTTSEPQTAFVPVCNHSRVALMQGGTGTVQEILISVFTSYGELLAENLSGSSAWIDSTLSCDTLLAFYNDCDIVMCVAPYHLIVDSVGAHEAFLDWETFGGESSWMVEYRAENDTVWSSVVANTHPFVLNSLAAQTSYYVRVRAICDDGSVSEYRNTEHFYTACDGVMLLTIGTPTFAGLPPDDRYPYVYSQQIYTADELQGVEDISNFQLMNAHYCSEYVWDIYLGHTTKSRFQDRNDFVDPQSLSLVYSGTIHDYDQTPQHWVTFQLDSTFHYNGTDNLVLAVYNHVGEYRMDFNWMVFRTGGWSDHNNQCFTATSDAAFTPTSQTLSSLMNANVDFSKNVIRFPKCCSTPYAVSVQPNSTDTTATVSWQPGGGELQWLLEYKTVSASEWTSVVCHQPLYLIAEVVPSVQYMGRVMAVCDTANGEGSGFVDFTFTVVPAAPSAYNIVASAGEGGTILPTGNVNVMAGYDMTFDIVPDTAAGYVIREVFVDEVAQGPVPAYTFYAVDADHTIRAEFLNTGINDLPEELIAVYPNPTNGKVRIERREARSEKRDGRSEKGETRGEKGEARIESIAIYDVYGKLVGTYQPADGGRDVARNVSAVTIDLSAHPAGLYFLRITTPNGVACRKVVKR